MESSWQTALLAASALGVPGATLMVVGIVVVALSRRRLAACTAVATGVVTDYRFMSGDNEGIAPVLTYQVNGRRYEVVRRFRRVSSVKVVAPWLPSGEVKLWVTPDDVLHVKYKGSGIMHYDRPARQLWPLGSTMPVYYNPDKPWQAYAQVKRSGSKGTAMILIILGAVMLCVLMPMASLLFLR